MPLTNSKHLKTLVIIDPGVRVAELESFNRIAQCSPIPVSYHLPALSGPESLWGLGTDHVGGIMIFGSGASVHDPLPWQDQLKKWLRPHLDVGTPLLGFCYGHQLVAHMAGGSVGLMTECGRKEQGLRRVKLGQSRLWGAPCAGDLVVSHREVVSSVPPDWLGVGASPVVFCEAMEHVSFPQWTFQAHPEATHQFVGHQEIDQEIQLHDFQFGWGLISSFLRKIT